MTARPLPSGRILPQRVAILGFARSGRALASALLDRGIEVAIGDRAPESAFEGLDELRARGARLFFGGPAEGFLDGAGWLALSPGVPLSAGAVAEARSRGIPVSGELELAWEIAEAEVEGTNRWVAITGTNGKSTTTAWIADILRRSGRPVALAGNIGVPLSAFLSERAPRDFVCEVSSFQLDTVEWFAPDVAVLTNVTPDHLDRYADFTEYAASKERVFARQAPGDFSVVNADDPIAFAAATRGRRVPFSRAGEAPGGAWLESGSIFSDVSGGPRRVLAADELSLPGAHNVENALAALGAAECLGVPPDAIRGGLTGFQGLPHRTELVAEAGGVRWVNDSKGTNVDATKKSLEGCAPASVILILGGRDKHGDFSALLPLVKRAARRVLTVGEAAPVIETAFGDAVASERAGTMDRAVARAAEIARPGDTVLLSPACASFDQYSNFEERGEHFAALARRMAGTIGGRGEAAAGRGSGNGKPETGKKS
ncbi:MAG: UDP-N-acetylmuramoyl-L-alanine--D-glutamate ligase [Acidobacteriota bacterium]